MQVFRISQEKYSSKLFASGAANRWNKKDEFVIYTGSSRALCSLEFLVHTNLVRPASSFKVMIITIADKPNLIKELDLKSLPKDWRKLSAYNTLQDIGSTWYQGMESLVLKVPSVIVPQEFNYIINTKHPDFTKLIKLFETEDFIWDERLFSK
jgi:RES domain-containing protein